MKVDREEVEVVQEEEGMDETGLKKAEHKEEKVVVEVHIWRKRWRQSRERAFGRNGRQRNWRSGEGKRGKRMKAKL